MMRSVCIWLHVWKIDTEPFCTWSEVKAVLSSRLLSEYQSRPQDTGGHLGGWLVGKGLLQGMLPCMAEVCWKDDVGVPTPSRLCGCFT